VGDELVGVGGVGAAEYDGGGGHGGGGLSSEIRPRVARVDLVGSAVGGHVLRPLPAVVVTVPISHLIRTPHVKPSIKI
jgi:hypothetical protein